MPNNYEDVRAKCPFYQGFTGDKIKCESDVEGAIAVLEFESKESCRNYKTCFCDRAFNQCRHCEDLFARLYAPPAPTSKIDIPEALALRLDGWSYGRLAIRYEVSKSRVIKVLKKYLKKIGNPPLPPKEDRNV